MYSLISKLEKREKHVTPLLILCSMTILIIQKRWRECISGQKIWLVSGRHTRKCTVSFQSLRWHCWYVLIEFEPCMTNRWRHGATSSEVRIFCCHKMCVKCRLLRTNCDPWSWSPFLTKLLKLENCIKSRGPRNEVFKATLTDNNSDNMHAWFYILVSNTVQVFLS